jgi:hypothetical protein
MTRMALAALIADSTRTNGWSEAEIARRGNRADERLTKTDVSNYKLRGMQTIVPYKIKALARGLGLPPYRVAIAVLEDVGITIPMDVRSPEQAIENDHTLSTHARRHLLAMLREARSDGT